MGAGREAKNVIGDQSDIEKALTQRAGNIDSESMQKLLSQYGQGGLSLEDALSQARGQGTEGLFSELAGTDARTGARMGEDVLKGTDLYGGMYNEMEDLQNRGYSLQPEDHEAYGQAAGDITRQFGQSEQNLAQTLAARGLSGSNASQAAFTGLQGSKNEQLAGQMRNIAQQRMDDTFKRLTQSRQMLQQGLGMQQGLAQAGRAQNQSERSDAANREFAQRQAEQGQYNTAFEQNEATRGPGLGEIFGSLGMAGLGGLTGGLGSVIGTGLGSKIMGSGSGGGKTLGKTTTAGGSYKNYGSTA